MGTTIDLAAVRRHIEDRFAATTLERLPFPHLIIENFFPDDVYEQVQAFNPYRENPGEEWISRKETAQLKTGTPYYARKQINFHKGVALDGPSDAVDFWGAITELFLGDHWFEQLVYRTWPDFFLIRFGALAEKPHLFEHFRRELFLQRHEPGYYIGPHTDIPTRVFTCIFSFADRPGFEQFGTELLRHKDEMVRCWGNNHYPPDDFIVEKVAPYKPNNFLLFFKTRQSFHSVRAIDETVPNQRYGMQLQCYEPPNGVFRDLSEPDIMTTRHDKDENRKKRQKSLARRVLDKVR